MIGLSPEELKCVRALLRLLRHPDPVVQELARHALEYLSQVAHRSPLATLSEVASIQ